MLKKTITYENFNDETVTEDHFFHLSKADLLELELSADGGMEARLKKIVEAGDNREIFAVFKKIMLSAYGERSEDGKRFIKTPTLRDEFGSSEAFSALVMDLLEDVNAASAFINGIIPKGLSEDPPKSAAPTNVVGQPKVKPAGKGAGGQKPKATPKASAEPTSKTLTRAEMIDMDSDELKSGLATGRYVIGA